MGQVMIRCPETKHQVPTGTNMSFEEFLAAKLAGGRVVCPECGEVHRWTKEQTELVTRVTP